MQFDLRSILLAMRATIVEPRKGARVVIGLQLSLAVGVMALALMIILSSILSVLAARIFVTAADEGIAALLVNPFQMVAMQGVVMAITLMLIMAVGRRFGGQGNLTQAVSLMAWQQAILNLLQGVQLLLLFVSPTFADLIGFASILLFLRLLSSFVAELHGFESTGTVLLMILAIGFLLSVLMAFLGIALFGLGAANV